jgi:hypothetical protein
VEIRGPDRFFQFELSLVQSLADYHAVQSRLVRFAEPFYIVETGNAARGRNAHIRGTNNRQCLLDVWSTEHSIASDIGINDSLDANIYHRSRKINCHHRRRGFPTPRHHVSFASINANADL